MVNGEPSFVERLCDRVRQFVCGLHGHDALLHYEHGRMSLLCSSCGYESPGWDLKELPRAKTGNGERIVRLPIGRVC